MILTKYIFNQSIKSVLVSTLVFIGVIWLSQSFKNIKLIIDKGGGLSDFFLLSLYSFPSWLLIALPFGTFAGCMISYMKLENDKEIIVMKSSGMSEIQISKPGILVAIIASIILFFISHFILPNTYRDFKILQNDIRNNSKDFFLKDNVFIDLNETQTIFIGSSNNNLLEKVFIKDQSDPANKVEYYSKSGSIVIDETVNLILNNGTKLTTNEKGQTTILNFERYSIEIKKDQTDAVSQRVIEYNEYSFFELINMAKKQGMKKGKLLAEAHYRNMIIFLPLVFVLFLMITVLKVNFSRKSAVFPKSIAIGIILIIQTIFIVVKNAVHTNITVLPLMYILPISLIIISLILLKKNKLFYNNHQTEI